MPGHIIRHHSQEFNLFRLHLCRALSRLAAAAGVTQQRWLNTCCQTCTTSRRLCPSRLDTSHTALNTCNIDTTLKKPPRWGLLNLFSDPQDTCIEHACMQCKYMRACVHAMQVHASEIRSARDGTGQQLRSGKMHPHAECDGGCVPCGPGAVRCACNS